METTVVLVDDHPLFRQGLHLLLDKQPDLQIVGEAGDGQVALELVRECSPDVVVMDITMPGLDGIEATRRILAESPQTRIVALSIHAEKKFVENMLGAGATGYILKDSVPEELVTGIRTVTGGEIFLSGTITDVVVSHYRGLVSGEEALSPPPDLGVSRIIRTKLHPPSQEPDLVPRSRLIEQLNRGRQRPFTLISASAGYGKTTLVSSWLDSIDSPRAWLSLDEHDDDLPTFLTYFIAAIQTLFPEVGRETLALLHAANLPPLSALARSLISELDQLTSAFALVLDDYHHIHQAAIHDLLTELLRHPSRVMHLVIITRRDPAFPITTLRARAQITEVRSQELRFTAAETALFLQQAGIQTSEATAAVLTQKTEGWVTGLRLFALSLRHRDTDAMEISPPENIRYITDYLVAETLSQLPPAIQDFLLKTSVLKRLNGSLCDAVAGLDEPECNGQAYLENLHGQNLFIISLDDQRTWYRYHHLFQELLQQRLHQSLAPEAIAELHRRASSWFTAHNLLDEAIHHALAAGEVIGAAEIIEKNRHVVLNEDNPHVIVRWLAHMPGEVVQQRPGLLLTRAATLYHQFRLMEIVPIIERLDSILERETIDQTLVGEINLYKGYLSYWQGQGEACLEFMSKAQAQIPEAHYVARGDLDLYFGVAHQACGRKELALKVLREKIQSNLTGPAILLTRQIASMAFVHLLSGELEQSTQAALQLRDVARKSGLIYTDTWSSYLRGCYYFHTYDLEKARHHFSAAAKNRYILHVATAVNSLAGLVITHQAMQQPEAANQAMGQLLEFARETNDPANISIADSCRARLSLLQGDLNGAMSWLRSYEGVPNIPAMLIFLEIPWITQGRVLVAQGSAAGLREAAEQLESSWQATQALHNTYQLIDIGVLLALAYYKLSRLDEALATLERTVTLAAPGGWIRPFVEPGPLMAQPALLPRLKDQGVVPDYIDRILAAFDHLPVDDRKTASRKPITQNLAEPLTDRELEVLALLAQGLTDKEIAGQLVISSGTVRQYTHKIYQKLAVNNRRQAVTKAIELEILPHDGA